ncbi:MAG: HAD family phosphatase [Treponema sp.]|nr:HAD family phosphatase [Treponema sp.]
MTIKAVIFDLDGTLLDTEKYFRINWPKTFEHFGYTMTDQQYLSIRSLGRPFIYETLKAYSGDPDFNYEEVRSYRSKLMEESLQQNGIELKKGAVQLLSHLKKKGIICAIATASPVDRSERYLKQTGILSYFDRIISARNMKEGKPSPDVYQFAVKELGLEPHECLAVEDSPNGVLSASRAGLKVAFVPDLTPADSKTEKLIYAQFQNLAELTKLF